MLDGVAFLSSIISPYRHRWLQGLAILSSVHVIELTAPYLLKVVLDRIQNGERDFLLPACGMVMVALLRFWVLRYGRRLNALIAIKVISRFRKRLYARVQTQPFEFFQQHSSGRIISSIVNDTEVIKVFFRSGVHRLVALASVVVIAPCFMATQAPFLTLILLGVIGSIGIVSASVSGPIQARSVTVQRHLARVTEHAQEALQRLSLSQAYNQEGRETVFFQKCVQDYAEQFAALGILNARLSASMIAMSAALGLAVVGFGAREVAAGDLTLGSLSAFVVYLSMIVGVVRECAFPVFLLLKASSAALLLEEIYGLGSRPTAPALTLHPSPAYLCLKDVQYSYGVGRSAINGLSAKLPHGKLISIIGPHGAGKTTLVRLLCGQIVPDHGSIEIGGVSPGAISPEARASLITVVTQEPYLFAGSIRHNISFGKPDCPIEDVWHAARIASISSTIQQLPGGMETLVGKGGLVLSGGQAQRLCLARGLIRSSPILILDDCLSALDAITAASVFRALKTDRQGMTTILITNSGHMASQADYVVAIDDGSVVVEGMPKDVLSKTLPLNREGFSRGGQV
ncbi:ABC transporter ATP-binding protein [Rhizobium leguminosarum]|uniref:ABC transporter ATP-binding protein n=1 Tax=Rhizobium leguminosarum TaxID=384 RepID=UPI001FD9C84D|nr:ABC transporter ATP-binding protein [Rhizobium leguminosarum]